MIGRHAARAFAAGLLLLATNAEAQPTEGEKKAAAQALFDEARALTTAGNWAAACPKLAESLKLDASMGTRFYLAECLEHTGRPASAWTYYIEVADAAKTAGQKDREKYASDRAEALRPRLPRLSIKVPPAARAAPGLQIERDGVPVGEAQWEIAIPIDPGTHAISARAPKRKAWTAEVKVEQEGQLVEVTVPALADEAPPPPLPKVEEKPAPPPPPPPPPPTGRRTAGFVIGGVGIAGVGVGLALGGLALAKKSQSNHAGGCDAATDVCDAMGLATRKDALGLATGSTVAFLVGLAAAGTGVVLVVTAPSATPTAAPSVAVGPAGASLTWRW